MQRDSSANFVVPNAQGQAKYSCLSNGREFLCFVRAKQAAKLNLTTFCSFSKWQHCCMNCTALHRDHESEQNAAKSNFNKCIKQQINY